MLLALERRPRGRWSRSFYSESSLGQQSAQKRSTLDDVPNSIKKYNVGNGQLAASVMFATKGSKDSWFIQQEFNSSSCLVGFHVTGARVHRTLRSPFVRS